MSSLQRHVKCVICADRLGRLVVVMCVVGVFLCWLSVAQDDVEAVAARCALKVDSSSSLESASSSSLHSSSQRGLDVPEEFEDIKRRKHVMEEGLAK